MTTQTPNLTLLQAFDHMCGREYMSGVARDKARIKATSEVFTPDDLVCDIIEKIIKQNSDMYSNPSKTILDPSCGDGQFLAWSLVYKLCKGDINYLLSNPEANTKNIFDEYTHALKHIYGVDLMKDNVSECRKRLACGFDTHKVVSKILKKNIRCEDSLTYDFSFT